MGEYDFKNFFKNPTHIHSLSTLATGLTAESRIIAFRISSNVFCLYGYPKNERDNISDAEETAFKKAAAFYLNLNEVQIDSLVKKGELVEVKDA